MLLFTRKIYPEINPEPEKEIIGRLRRAIFTDTDRVDARTVILVAIANSSNLLPAIFDRKKLKLRKRRIKDIVNGDVSGKATKEAIAAMQTAVMMSVMTSTMIMTATR